MNRGVELDSASRQFPPHRSTGKQGEIDGHCDGNESRCEGRKLSAGIAAAADVFTPADLTDDQKLIGQTAEEFVVKEVLPLVKELENKKPGLMAELVRKGGEVGLMGGGVPEQYGGAGLDKMPPRC